MTLNRPVGMSYLTWCQNIQHNDTHHHAIHNNDPEPNSLFAARSKNDTQHNNTLALW
jgi:hypothetical protein